jgi:hypothetical protein
MNLILDVNCSGAYDEGRAKQLVSEFDLSVVICTSFKSPTTPSIPVLPISIHSKDTTLYHAYPTEYTYSISFIYILAIVGNPKEEKESRDRVVPPAHDEHFIRPVPPCGSERAR